MASKKGDLVVTVYEARGLKNGEPINAYCSLTLLGDKSKKNEQTRIEQNVVDPKWRDQIYLGLNTWKDELQVEIWDQLKFTKIFLGQVQLPFLVLKLNTAPQWYSLVGSPNHMRAVSGDILLKLEYVPAGHPKPPPLDPDVEIPPLDPSLSSASPNTARRVIPSANSPRGGAKSFLYSSPSSPLLTTSSPSRSFLSSTPRSNSPVPTSHTHTHPYTHTPTSYSPSINHHSTSTSTSPAAAAAAEVNSAGGSSGSTPLDGIGQISLRTNNDADNNHSNYGMNGAAAASGGAGAGGGVGGASTSGTEAHVSTPDLDSLHNKILDLEKQLAIEKEEKLAAVALAERYGRTVKELELKNEQLIEEKTKLDAKLDLLQHDLETLNFENTKLQQQKRASGSQATDFAALDSVIKAQIGYLLRSLHKIEKISSNLELKASLMPNGGTLSVLLDVLSSLQDKDHVLETNLLVSASSAHNEDEDDHHHQQQEKSATTTNSDVDVVAATDSAPTTTTTTTAGTAQHTTTSSSTQATDEETEHEAADADADAEAEADVEDEYEPDSDEEPVEVDTIPLYMSSTRFPSSSHLALLMVPRG